MLLRALVPHVHTPKQLMSNLCVHRFCLGEAALPACSLNIRGCASSQTFINRSRQQYKQSLRLLLDTTPVHAGVGDHRRAAQLGHCPPEHRARLISQRSAAAAAGPARQRCICSAEQHQVVTLRGRTAEQQAAQGLAAITMWY